MPVTVSHLKKTFGKIEAVKDVSFEVKTGEIFALIGPNGAGKSTTLRILATLLSLTSGQASVYGFDIVRQAESIRKIISYLPEEAGAYKNMTGLSYLTFMAGIFAKGKKELDRFLEKGTLIANLGERMQDKIGTYSKGMVRKLLLARTVMVDPRLAILDEPTSGLDIVNALEIRGRIKKMAKEGMAVLLSSHNMLEIEYLSDRVAIIDKGIIHVSGTPKDLKEKYQAQNLEEVFVKLT